MTQGYDWLEDGETVLAAAGVSFRGSAATSVRTTFRVRASKARSDEYEAWREVAQVAGFPTAGPEMYVVVTNARLVVCHTTFWFGRAGDYEGAVAFADLAQVAVERHGLVTGLALLFTTGAVVEVESMHGHRLERFAETLRAALAGDHR